VSKHEAGNISQIHQKYFVAVNAAIFTSGSFMSPLAVRILIVEINVEETGPCFSQSCTFLCQ